MSKKLYCHECTAYLGEIEKGRIKKGATVRCPKCEQTFSSMKIAMEMRMKGGDPSDYGGTAGAINDAIKSMFGGKL